MLDRRVPQLAPLLEAAKARLAAVRRKDRAEPAPLQAEDEPSLEPERRLSVEIQTSDAAWRLLIKDEAGEIVTRRTGAFVELVSDVNGQISAVDGVRAAIDAIAPAERSVIGAISIAALDPAITFADARALGAVGGDRAGLARLAESLLDEDESGYDASRWPAGSADGGRLAMALAPLDVVRRYTAALGDLAPYVTTLTPLASAYAPAHDGPSATLHFGIDSSILVVADPEAGAIAHRFIPVGVRAFARYLAEANSLPFQEALKALKNTKLLQRAGAIEAPPPVAALSALITETLDYVADSRLAEPPRQVSVLGAHGEVQGLTLLLAQASSVDLVALDDAPEAMAPLDINLFRSLKSPLFASGSRVYRFQGDRFVAEEPDETTVVKPKINLAPEGPFAGLRKRLPALDLDTEIPGRQLALAGVAGMALLGLLAHSLIAAPAIAGVDRGAGTFRAAGDRTTAMDREVETLRRDAIQTAIAGSGVDKILWTEKLVAIADALPPGLWLTAVEVANQERQVGRVEVTTTKFILKGQAQSSADVRLQDIAKFIDALERDEEFMRDFRQIVFGGLGGEGDGPVAGFEVHAWYDENKRREASGADSAAPLGQARSASAAQQARTAIFGDGR